MTKAEARIYLLFWLSIQLSPLELLNPLSLQTSFTERLRDVGARAYRWVLRMLDLRSFMLAVIVC
jgi:hypothetical protein